MKEYFRKRNLESNSISPTTLEINFRLWTWLSVVCLTRETAIMRNTVRLGTWGGSGTNKAKRSVGQVGSDWGRGAVGYLDRENWLCSELWERGFMNSVGIVVELLWSAARRDPMKSRLGAYVALWRWRASVTFIGWATKGVMGSVN